MHIPDGFLNTHAAAGLAGAAAAGFAYAVAKARHAFMEKVPVLRRAFATFPHTGGGEVGWQSRMTQIGREKIWRMASVASLIFAAQMVNFSIGNGVSGHVLGGVLAALILGPFEGFIVISLVLAMQAFAFGDGGVIALGANIVNMGLVGTLGGYALFVGFRKIMARVPHNFLLSAGLAAWLSVLAAAAAASLELSLSGTVFFAPVFSEMMKYHLVIGFGEGVITVGALAALMRGTYPLAALEDSRTRDV